MTIIITLWWTSWNFRQKRLSFGLPVGLCGLERPCWWCSTENPLESRCFLIWSYYPYNYYTFFVRYIYIYICMIQLKKNEYIYILYIIVIYKIDSETIFLKCSIGFTEICVGWDKMAPLSGPRHACMAPKVQPFAGPAWTVKGDHGATKTSNAMKCYEMLWI